MQNKEHLCSAPAALHSTGNHVHAQLRLYLDSLHMLTWTLLFPIVLLHLVYAKKTTPCFSSSFSFLLLYRCCYVCAYVLIMDIHSFIAPFPKDRYLNNRYGQGQEKKTVVFSLGRNNSTSSRLLRLFPCTEMRRQQHTWILKAKPTQALTNGGMQDLPRVRNINT